MADFKRILVIPDTQCKPGVSLDHMDWAGRYAVDKKPDVIVHLGDNWDLESLSDYDRDKPRLFEGRRVKRDIEAGNDGLLRLTRPIQEYDKARKKKTRRIILRGNHEERLRRAVDRNPAQLEGVLDEASFNDKALGWEVVPFLRIIAIGGIAWTHYFYSPRTGKPYGGVANNVLTKVGRSFIQGHRQGLDVAIQDVPGGGRRRGIIAGSFYQHHEDYIGPQGNDHWRGLLLLHEVRDGNFDLCEVSLDFLKRNYS